MITEQSTLHNFLSRTELMFALPLPQFLTIMLKYCQQAILKDFKRSSKIIQRGQKSQKVCAKQFVHAFEKLNESQRIRFYYQISGYILKMTNGRSDPPRLNLQNIKKQAYIRYGTFKIWNKRQVIYDRINHVLQIKRQKNQEKIRINLSFYMMRNSKNGSYYAFVLQACDKRAVSNLRSVTMGFDNKNDLQAIMQCVRDSISFRWQQKIQAMFKGDAFAKNSINSIKNELFYQNNNNISQICPEEQFYSFQELSIAEDENLRNSKNSHQFQIWKIQQKFQEIANHLQWQSLIQCEQFTLKKYKQKEQQMKGQNILLINIPICSKNSINYYYNKFKQMPSKEIQSIRNYRNNIYIQKIKQINNSQPVSFFIQREEKKISQNEIIIHQFPNNPQKCTEYQKQTSERIGNYQAIWRFQSISQQIKQINLIIELTTDKHNIRSQKQLKFSIQYLRGVFERFIEKDISIEFKFFDKNTIQLDDKTEMIKTPSIKKYSIYTMQPIAKGLHQLLSNQSNKQSLITQEWKIDEKGNLQFINQQKIAAQKGVIKSIISQLSRNILSGKSILNISLPVEIFSTESHLYRLLHSLRLAPVLLEEISLLQKQNISETHLKQILKQSAVFGITTSILYLNQQKSFNPILGETCQIWIDGCPAYAEQISHHPPISAIYFVGRGYKIYGQLEAKVQLGLNCGKGSNDGEVIIQFDNGIRVVNYFAAGEVSGLSYGKRKFSIVGKSHHFIQKTDLYLQVDYSSKKQQSGINNINTRLFKINKNQQTQFRKKRKFKNPKTHIEISQQYPYLMHGCWSKSIKSNQNVIINIQSTKIPYVDRELYLLPSDSLYRQDILFRSKKDYTTAQKYKSMLQENQRRDRKLREKSK